MLAELMRLRYAIAVAGAHGKTTTTSMIAVMLERAGLDPTAVIGDGERLWQQRTAGTRRVDGAEADESDRSFLRLFPTIAVMTNIDHEHLESYGGSVNSSRRSSISPTSALLRGRGGVRRDTHLAAVLPRITRRIITYGLETATADVMADDVVLARERIGTRLPRTVDGGTAASSAASSSRCRGVTTCRTRSRRRCRPRARPLVRPDRNRAACIPGRRTPVSRFVVTTRNP